jgi:hypothetical protein
VQAELAPRPAPPRAQLLRWWFARLPRWAAVLTALNALIVLTSLWWVWQTRRELARAQGQVRVAQNQLQVVQNQLQEVRRQLGLRALLRSDVSQAHGALLETTTSQAVLIVRELPRLQPGRVYQLWLRHDPANPDNGGIFRVDDQGFGILLVQAPQPLSAYSIAGITEEPDGGSPGPTSRRVIGGPFSHPES